MITELDTEAITGISGLTPEHKERRKRYVTASDMPAIIGLDPYRTAMDVWLEKTGKAPPREGSQPAAIGTALEAGVLQLASAVIGQGLTKSGAWVVYDGFLGATLDAWTADRKSLCQVKTSGKVEEWEQGPPPRVVVQTHVEMICAEVHTAFIAAILGGPGPLKLRCYRVEIEPTSPVTEGLIEVASRFYGCLCSGQPPKESIASLDTLRRIVWVPGHIVDVPAELVTSYIAASEARKKAEKDAKALKHHEEQALAAVIQTDPTGDTFQCGLGMFVRTQTPVKSYTVAARVDERIVFKPHPRI